MTDTVTPHFRCVHDPETDRNHLEVGGVQIGRSLWGSEAGYVFAWLESLPVSVQASLVAAVRAPSESIRPSRYPTSKKLHDVKIWPAFFHRVLSGAKRFEVRRNDRGYKIGDGMLLREWFEPNGVDLGHYSGREVRVIILDLMETELMFVMPGYVILSIEVAK